MMRREDVLMKPGELHYTGRVWVFGDDINTDLMLPGFSRGTHIERAKYCMHANRPGWAAQVSPGDIIIGGRNFGCGSNRPAPLILKILGIGCLVAESVFHIFFRNAMNDALPTMGCSGVTGMFNEGDLAEVNFLTGMITNQTTNETRQGQVLPKFLLDIIQAGGLRESLRRGGYIK
jgi:3-isopropylmalate/(R)-2-methylmalate dehydratase small subunit